MGLTDTELTGFADCMVRNAYLQKDNLPGRADQLAKVLRDKVGAFYYGSFGPYGLRIMCNSKGAEVESVSTKASRFFIWEDVATLILGLWGSP